MTDTRQLEIVCLQVAMGRAVVKILFPVAVICRAIQVSIQYLLTANIGRNSQHYMKLVETFTALLKSRQARRTFHVRSIETIEAKVVKSGMRLHHEQGPVHQYSEIFTIHRI